MFSRTPAAAIRSGIAAFLFLTLVILGLASEGTVPPTLPQKERVAESQKFVQWKLRVWQQRLNLNDWNIHVHLVRSSVLEPKTLGNVHWDTNKKEATIDVLSPLDYTLPKPEMLDDMEVTIVHELVHLDLSSLPRTDSTRLNEEYAVNQLTRALLDLARR
jgi:hypothetical protein